MNISTGSEKLRSNTSLGYFKQDGIAKNSSFERYTFRSSNEYVVNDKVKLGLNVSPMIQNYTNLNTDGQRQILSASLSADPCANPYDENGELTVSINSPGTFGQPNWIRYIKERETNYLIYNILGNAYADVDIWQGLKYRFQLGVDLGARRQREWVPSTSNGNWTVAPPQKASGSHNSEIRYSWTAENLLTYEKQIGEHHFDLLAGYSAQKFRNEIGNLSGTDFPDDEISWIRAAATKNGDAYVEEWALASMLGRVNYSFKDRYYLQLNVRRDGCSRFGSENRYATFPSVSAGWIFSDESFMQGVTDVMNYAKLKASYGVVGNYNIGNYDHWSNVGTGNYVLGGSLAPGKGLSNIGNNQLTWEETKEWDLGIEAGFLNDRIFLTYDYYQKNTEGLLYQIDLPYSTGFENIKANIGKFKAWGHEIGLVSRNMVGNFKWKTNLNMTFSRNKVLALGPNNASIGGVDNAEDWNKLEVGQPIGIIVGYVFDGVYMTQAEFDSQPKHATSEVGSARMKDTNGDGVIDIYDRVKIADPNPDMIFGITNDFEWKNFDLSIFMQGQIGGDIVAGIYENSWNLDGVFNVDKEVQYRWRSEENPGNGKIPRTLGKTTELFRLYHSGMVYKATYLSIRNITLGYSVPLKANKYVSRLRPYFSIQNLHTFKYYPGMNPEASSSSGLNWKGLGIDRTNTPVPRTFTIGCNITF
ncbi:MAG: SusC/RagA family TonB-linked outer membrane protein [Tannerellaceae bacterium]|nr:SusC/RagA family TonB-linked outer membrane protein [Tannerellaceae bacterium]